MFHINVNSIRSQAENHLSHGLPDRLGEGDTGSAVAREFIRVVWELGYRSEVLRAQSKMLCLTSRLSVKHPPLHYKSDQRTTQGNHAWHLETQNAGYRCRLSDSDSSLCPTESTTADMNSVSSFCISSVSSPSSVASRAPSIYRTSGRSGWPRIWRKPGKIGLLLYKVRKPAPVCQESYRQFSPRRIHNPHKFRRRLHDRNGVLSRVLICSSLQS